MTRYSAFLILVSSLIGGCGGKDNPPASPVVRTLDADSLAALHAAPQATLIPNGVAGNDPLARGLQETSAWFAPEMTPESPMAKTTLAEKGHARTEVKLFAGKCYKLVGFSPQGQVTDYDLRLVSASGGLVAEDSDDDTTPTIGSPMICPSVNTSYTVDLFADHGSGDVALQLYSKPK